MGMADIFEGDLFQVRTLTAAINEAPFVPRRIGELGWFQAEGISTTSVSIEKDGSKLALVEAKPRGADGAVVNGDKRHGIPFNAVHLPQRATIYADEVQNVREFGTEDSLRAIETVRNTRLEKMRRNLEATHEFHRIGGIRGKILDADGTTELVDVYDRFQLTQHVVDMLLNTESTQVEGLCLDILELIEDELGGSDFMTVRAVCGKAFWRKLIGHKRVREAYVNWEAAARLAGDQRAPFEFGGIIWERYRGKVGSIAYVPDEEAFAVPEGVDDFFITRFAPADYVEAVNTIGLPVYAKAELLRFGKGIELEAQSNPIHLPTRPKAIIKLRMHNGG